MRILQRPPPFHDLLRKYLEANRLDAILELARKHSASGQYQHWDKIRRLKPPSGLTHEEWWFATKFHRVGELKTAPCKDSQGNPFRFCIPDLVQEELHTIDFGAGRAIGIPEPITNPQTRDRYLIRSL